MNLSRHNTVRILLTLYTLLVLSVFTGITSTLLGRTKDVNADAPGGFCSSAADCFAVDCEYPEATYCTTMAEETDGNSRCRCRDWVWQRDNGFNGCQSDPYVEPPLCTDGWQNCGVSGNHDTDPDCIRRDDLVAEGRCGGCNNPSNVYRYCRKIQQNPPAGCYESCSDRSCNSGLVCDPSRGNICVNPDYPDSSTCLPPEDEPFCGDGICRANETCERVESGSNIFRECEIIGENPTGALVSVCRNIHNSPSEPDVAYQCTFCGDGVRQPIEECDYAVDANCNSNCTIKELIEGIDIDKTAINEHVYQVGEQVRFAVRVTNTGESTFDIVRFRDTWDRTYLSFIGGSVVKNTGEYVADIRPLIDTQTSSEFIINDLTDSILGDLAPNEFYQFELIYTAIAPTPNYNPQTCNYAFVRADDLAETNDDDCVNIDNRDTDA